METRVPIEVVEMEGVRVDLGKNSNGVFLEPQLIFKLQR